TSPLVPMPNNSIRPSRLVMTCRLVIPFPPMLVQEPQSPPATVWYLRITSLVGPTTKTSRRPSLFFVVAQLAILFAWPWLAHPCQLLFAFVCQSCQTSV